VSSAARAPDARASWRAVALPSEHGGWGLTLEPALLGLLVAPSIAGVAIAFAALLAFLVRTPTKFVLVDRYRHRTLARTRIAARIAIAEVVALVALVAFALARASADWMLPFAVALPLFAVELSFDARSRSRRLLPELCGAVGITATVAAIVVAGGEPSSLAVALWMVLGARAVASVPFARVQVLRLKSGVAPVRVSDLAQVAGVLVAIGAWLVDPVVALGSGCVVLVTLIQLAWSRGPARPAIVVGLGQLGLGLTVVGATALGVALA